MKKVLSVFITVALMLQLLAMFGTVYAEGTAQLTVSSVSGTEGDTVTVEVGIKNNPGFDAFECTVKYDSEHLKLLSVEGKIGKPIDSGDSNVNHQFIAHIDEEKHTAGLTYMGWHGVEMDFPFDRVYDDVTIATLKFELLKSGEASVWLEGVRDASLPGLYTVDVESPTPETEVPYTLAPGTITIAEKPAYLLGDVNGDTRINIADAIAIRQYIINKTKYPLVAGVEAADVNGDSRVNIADAIAIRQYIINKNKYPFAAN